MAKVRLSLQEVQTLYDTGENRSILENLVRAFRVIQRLPAKDAHSFFTIAGFHGMPFRGKGETDPDWWGGYCNHGNVLFPTWHRAYLLYLENALRTASGIADVTLPFWDECLGYGGAPPPVSGGTPVVIPSVLTSPTFELDGDDWNPLYSYKLQEALFDNVEKANQRYTKPKDYATVRYPLSGLVGTEEDRKTTEVHNAKYRNAAENIELLNGNVVNWLEGKVEIDDDGETPMPDTFSVYSRFRICLDAPNYTVFSNTRSQNQWIIDNGGVPGKDHFVVALESPHNAIHLAVGGFYQKGKKGYNADPIRNANGDMGDNETAGFDPIFFFHHCFIDYVFWTWQKKTHNTASLSIIDGYKGTISVEGLPNIEPNTPLTLDTPLYPFKQPNGNWYTSNAVTDITTLGYTYGSGSLDPVHAHVEPILGGRHSIFAPIVHVKRVYNISRTNYEGSFVIRTSARGVGRGGNWVEIAREPILSRWNLTGCKNCQDKLDVESLVPIDEALLRLLSSTGDEKGLEYKVDIQTHELSGLRRGPIVPGAPRIPSPIVGDI